MQTLALWLYSLAIWLATPLLKRKLRRRALNEPGYAVAVPERFGQYEQRLAGQGGTVVWLHAVSLGETRAAAILLKELRAQLPGMRLLLTHGTATGRAEGAKLLQAGDMQVWQPWDTPGAVRRFLRQFRPAIGILMETEIWPNLAAGCRAFGVPLVLANARLNEKSRVGAQRLAWLSRPAYAGLAAVWAQTQDDAARLRDVGAPVAGVFGNLKFDIVPVPEQQARGRSWRDASPRPVLLLASTREGEEAMWLDVLKQKSLQAPAGKAQAAIKSEVNEAVQWLLVPRHPQRFDEVQRLCEAAGLSVARRSQWTDGPQQADVWLGDSLGEMALYYSLAHVALLGGSYAPLGGQNLIEAAACGCPLVMGPHTFNFAEAAQMAISAGAALRVADMKEGVAAAIALAHDRPRQASLADGCQAFTQAHRGAARATADAIARQLGACMKCI
ncbi:MAG: 3-deoxy-D-manno-octulosonic acid transferase [Proteobacteria bacterium]|nr:3-deoxy-D-manno-octulosonic acid transferase [Pseudomonadota bacterium]MBS0492378.1 3-deoxy-D-manno-octulosonic acid transferase [Pseudomonadota bacterium]